MLKKNFFIIIYLSILKKDKKIFFVFPAPIKCIYTNTLTKNQITKQHRNTNQSSPLIHNEFFNFIHKYKFLIKRENKINDKSTIWIIWHQGIKNSPPIIKIWINSIINNAGIHHVCVLKHNNSSK